jgi:UDP-N-acetylglucosamine 2-epimerase (non-hydrolysing)
MKKFSSVMSNKRESSKLCFIVGTRPEFIKMAPIIHECERRKLDFFIIHTGQHYSSNLDKIFFRELSLPHPKYNLGMGSGTQLEVVTGIMLGVAEILKKEKVFLVLVQGDTNSVLGGALSAVKMGIKVAHVESGLRSYDREMPEEINRILVDHCSDFLFAPTSLAVDHLREEGISSRLIFKTGNTVVDALKLYRPLATKKPTILNDLLLTKNSYFLLTLHRGKNVDDRKRIYSIMKGVSLFAYESGLKCVFPIHPRARKMLELYKIKINPRIILIDPVGYFDFTFMEANARLILTDSGGVQEEACILGIPCVTLRDNTERPETIQVGANILSEVGSVDIARAGQKMLRTRRKWVNPFGSGDAAVKIVDILVKNKVVLRGTHGTQ